MPLVQPPRALVSSGAHQPFLAYIASLEQDQISRRTEKDGAHTSGRAAQNAAALSLHKRHAGDPEASSTLNTALRTLRDGVLPHRSPEDEDHGLSNAAQQVATAQIFEAFLATGTLGARPTASAAWEATAPPPVPEPREVGAKAPRPDDASTTANGDDANADGYTDEEWLGGLLSAAHEIGRYAVGAATVGDVSSVRACRAVVTALHEHLAQFDFRNGPLRRSFDGLKYTLRRLEDTIYELSLFPPPGGAGGGSTGAEGAGEALLDVSALEKAREAYAALDAAREAVIKKCREPQKLAKQAIYSLHRGDTKGAKKNLDGARKLALAILETDLSAQPSLRQQGSVRAMLEELAEAALFDGWLLTTSELASRDASQGGEGSEPRDLLTYSPGHIILLRGDESLLGEHLQPSEYLGAVCDLVGEIGRYAVRRATERDAAEVRACLATAVAVQQAVLSLGSAAPRGLHKKGDALRTAVRKMEALLYELSLVERSGRVREAPPDVDPAAQSGAAAAADGEE
jgi:predicted translin family RNA/ssDNA-binding protein